MEKGFIRRIDSLGRIVIPKDLRKEININDNDLLNIIVEKNHIEIYKHLYNDNLQKVVNYVNLSKSLLNADIYVTSMDSVLNDNKILLTKDIIDIIKMRKDYYSNHNISLINVRNKYF